jgi:hypothetical protein
VPRIYELKHGGARLHIKLYRVWNTMKHRCYSPKNSNFGRYGAKGVTVCAEWLSDPVTFINWALQNGYAPGLTIDRKNPVGNYEPGNCRWTDRATQARNRRRNTMLTFNGETKCVGEWAAQYRLHDSVVHVRIFRSGWSIEEALTTPLKFKRRA